MRDIDYDRETPNDLLTLQSIELKAVADVEFLTQLMRFVDQYLPEQEKVNLDIIPPVMMSALKKDEENSSYKKKEF